jgi:Primase X
MLENPLSDYRKYLIWRILSPYLLNVKNIPKEESYSVIKDWLDKCSKLERLNFNAKLKIKDGLKGARGYFPISLEKLKEENRELYEIVGKLGRAGFLLPEDRLNILLKGSSVVAKGLEEEIYRQVMK